MSNAAFDRMQAGRAVAAGLCATLVGIGLSRFAYAPLIPALVAAGWFPPPDTAYLGAANLTGYLAGALAARRLAAWQPPRTILRAMLAVATLSFFACAMPLSFGWFMAWRLVSGVAGGTLMVLAAPAVLASLPAHRRGLAGGIIFAGVGLGIVAAGLLVAPLLSLGLVEAWCGLGALALLLSAVAWNGWPPAAALPAAARSPVLQPPPSVALRALYSEYALNAVGLVPHMVFLVDFVARGRGEGLDAGARYWVLFGLGATAGPVLTGLLADRIGFGPALRAAFAIQAMAIGLVALPGSGALVVSSLVVGAVVPGIVPLVLGRTAELVGHPEARHAAWSTATTAFAIGQALAAYGFSFLFERHHDHVLLFGLGAGILALALLVDLVAGVRAAPDTRRRVGATRG